MKEKEEGEAGKGGGKKHGKAESRKTALSEALARVLPIYSTTSATSSRVRPRLSEENSLIP